MLGWLLSTVYLVVLVWQRTVWPALPLNLGLVLMVIGLVFGNLLPTLDKRYLYPVYEGKGLVTRSLLFIGALLPLGLFMLTSTGSELGTGLVMGLLFNTLDKWWNWRRQPEIFNQKVFFQFGRQLKANEINALVAILTVIVGWFVGIAW